MAGRSLGIRDLEVRIECKEEPIYRMKVDAKVKGARLLEMKKVSQASTSSLRAR